jgi:hypothetical protein
MIDFREIPKTRAIFIKYLPPTNYKGSRLKFKDIRNKTESKIVSFSYLFIEIETQIYNQLINSGFNVVGRASTKKEYIFFVDNWGKNFISIKDLINTNQLEKIGNNE